MTNQDFAELWAVVNGLREEIASLQDDIDDLEIQLENTRQEINHDIDNLESRLNKLEASNV